MRRGGLEKRLEIRIAIKTDGGVGVRLVCPCGELLAEDFDGGGGFVCECGYRCTVEEASELAQGALREVATLMCTLIEQSGIHPLAVYGVVVCPQKFARIGV